MNLLPCSFGLCIWKADWRTMISDKLWLYEPAGRRHLSAVAVHLRLTAYRLLPYKIINIKYIVGRARASIVPRASSERRPFSARRNRQFSLKVGHTAKLCGKILLVINGLCFVIYWCTNKRNFIIIMNQQYWLIEYYLIHCSTKNKVEFASGSIPCIARHCKDSFQ